MLTIREVDPMSPTATALIAALDADLQARYPGAPIHALDASTLRASGGVFLVGTVDDEPVACGALRPCGPACVEVKRMFVRAGARRRGYARALLLALEGQARIRGAAVIRLETGDAQPEAIRLYEDAGYTPIPCFDEYAGSPHSRCFEKKIAIDRVP